MRFFVFCLMVFTQLYLFSENSTLIINDTTFSFFNHTKDIEALRFAENSTADFFDSYGQPQGKFYAISIIEAKSSKTQEGSLYILLNQGHPPAIKTFNIAKEMATIWFSDPKDESVRELIAYKQVQRFHGDNSYKKLVGKLYSHYIFGTPDENDKLTLQLLINNPSNLSTFTLNNSIEITDSNLDLQYLDYIIDYKTEAFNENIVLSLGLTLLCACGVFGLFLFRPKNDKGRHADKIAALIITGIIQIAAALISFLLLPMKAADAMILGILWATSTGYTITFIRTRFRKPTTI